MVALGLASSMNTAFGLHDCCQNNGQDDTCAQFAPIETVHFGKNLSTLADVCGK